MLFHLYKLVLYKKCSSFSIRSALRICMKGLRLCIIGLRLCKQGLRLCKQGLRLCLDFNFLNDRQIDRRHRYLEGQLWLCKLYISISIKENAMTMKIQLSSVLEIKVLRNQTEFLVDPVRVHK